MNGKINYGNETGLFDYFWLNNGGICSLCGSRTLITFIVTPVVSGVITYLASYVDVKVRGEERARMPVIPLSFDREGDDYRYDKKNKNDDNDSEKAVEEKSGSPRSSDDKEEGGAEKKFDLEEVVNAEANANDEIDEDDMGGEDTTLVFSA